jgi:chaperonin GroES
MWPREVLGEDEPYGRSPMNGKQDIEGRRLSKKMAYDIVEPVGDRVLIRKDEDRHETQGGIQLPDTIKIPVLTARVVAISAEVEMSEFNRISQYDKVLVDPSNAVPVDFENDKLYLVPADDIMAVLRRSGDS